LRPADLVRIIERREREKEAQMRQKRDD
jgi:hypothetical protein